MENEDLDDEQKKMQERIDALDVPINLQNARWILEYNFHLKNDQNNEQNNLKKFPEVDYDDAIQ